MVSRRSALGRVATLAGAVGLSGCSQYLDPGGEGDDPPVEGENPHDVPARQHAWEDTYPVSEEGNPTGPGYHRVLLLRLDSDPSTEDARTVERAMRTLEAAYDWSPEGLLHMLAWGTDYFERIGELGRSPIDKPRVLSRTDQPVLEGFDATLVLATDVPSHLGAVESAMFKGSGELNGQPVEDRLGDVFSRAGRRTGFMGAGLPAEHTDAEGIPEGHLNSSHPMFTGFLSGRKGTLASEDRVTIGSGRFAGGTTMHLSHLTESLDTWWNGLDDAGRVARMFSPQFEPEDIERFTTHVPFTDEVREHAREFGVVGHHEKVAQVREDGEPLILRRDFNTVDGGHAGVHFLSLQRTLSQFRKTRKAMNGWYVRDDHEAITDRDNNGLLNFINVERRANFYVPPRAQRAFPLL
jgi:hypothetical protein